MIGEKLINTRELHKVLENKRKFADWIKQRIEHYKFAEYQKTKEYYLTINMAKKLCMGVFLLAILTILC